MNLFSLGLTAMHTAQHGLSTTGHNINNVHTPGYNRQTIVTETVNPKNTSHGFIGQGVKTTTILRQHNEHLYQQFSNSKSKEESIITYGNQINKINNSLADRTTGVHNAIQEFFHSSQAIASNPSDHASRQEFIGRAQNLTTQIQSSQQELSEQYKDINAQINTITQQSNSYITQIQELNQQILNAQNTHNHTPNDLLDLRDQLTLELNSLIGIKTYEQDGQISLTLNSGEPLLTGNVKYNITALPSLSDPSKLSVHTSNTLSEHPVYVEINDKNIKTGQLGGLLSYREDVLVPTMNSLGRISLGLVHEINTAHQQGFDPQGNPGKDIFSISISPPISHTANISDTNINIRHIDSSSLSTNSFTIRFQENSYQIKDSNSDTWLKINDGDTHQGMTFHLPDTAQNGDSWIVNPLLNSASSIQLNLHDPSLIASSGVDQDGNPLGISNGDNMIKLSQLQTKPTLNNTMSFNDAFSQLVNNIAIKTSQNTVSNKAQNNLIQQNFTSIQSLSGVNLNEEIINLERYLQQFQAASKMIDVGTAIFDTLLKIKQ